VVVVDNDRTHVKVIVDLYITKGAPGFPGAP